MYLHVSHQFSPLVDLPINPHDYLQINLRCSQVDFLQCSLRLFLQGNHLRSPLVYRRCNLLLNQVDFPVVNRPPFQVCSRLHNRLSTPLRNRHPNLVGYHQCNPLEFLRYSHRQDRLNSLLLSLHVAQQVSPVLSLLEFLLLNRLINPVEGRRLSPRFNHLDCLRNSPQWFHRVNQVDNRV